MYRSLCFLVCVFVATRVYAQSPAYGQCGGIGWNGATTCVSGYACSVLNDYYSQCLPGAATTTAATSVTSGGPTASAPGATPTLVPGYSFIRAVADPNFHKYLQSEVPGTASDAVLGAPANAALFKISGGQLIQGVSGTLLYAVVESPVDSSVKRLKVSWSTSPASSGSFVFSGDTAEWSSPSISRPQNNAWLVCTDEKGNKDVYINLGPYGYQTPAGCADQTIHGYTGPYPND